MKKEPEPKPWWRFFSPFEQQIWDALKPGEVVSASELAARVGRQYEDEEFQVILENLVDRHVLLYQDGRYARAGNYSFN